MTTPSVSTARPDRLIRPPGVYVEGRAPVSAGVPALMTGVPAFVGFARPSDSAFERRGGPAVVIDRWDADWFDRSIVLESPGEARDSFLRMAVRGFFANGGKRCVVLGVPHDKGTNGLVKVLESGGPLEDRSDIDLICIPDAVRAREGGGSALYEIQAAALAHCEAMGNRFAILDGPEIAAQDPVDEMLDMASKLRSAFGALYFPWIVVDPASEGLTSLVPRVGSEEWRCPPRRELHGGPSPKRCVPPCGHVAGLFARIDGLIGPQRSPANAILEDVVDTAVSLTARQYALLNEGGVNCLRSLRGRGVEMNGARTLSGQSAWAYVSTARVILTFRRWLAVGMRDLVFEPQTTALWERIRIRLVSHCLELYQSGALAGTDAAQAFFVKCDGETNAPDERDLGRVVAHVGLAVSVPAEFIVVRVVRDAGGFMVGELS